MTKKDRNILSILSIAFSIISLVSFFLLAMFGWRLAQYGGLRNYLSKLIAFSVIFVLSTIIFLVINSKNKKEGGSFPLLLKRILLIAFILTTVFWSSKIYKSAQPFNGALSWKINEWLNHRTYEFTHKNILDDGILGFLNDIKLDDEMKEKLYLSDKLQVRIDSKGEITFLEGLIYGDNADGKTKSFLVYYDKAKDDNKINVILNGYVDATYGKEKLLKPAGDITLSEVFKEYVSIFLSSDQAISYEIEYGGISEFKEYKSLVQSNAIVVSDDRVLEIRHIDESDSIRGTLKAYTVSIKPSNSDKYKHFLSQAEFIEPEKVNEIKDNEDIEQASHEEKWKVTDDGSILYVSKDNSEKIWKLTVVDAALGSYFYKLEESRDAGTSWKDLNSDPFNNDTGQAQGMIFFDENFGFIAMDGKGGDRSSLYRTENGGRKFEKVDLNRDQIKTLPQKFKEFNLKIEDFNYITLPEMVDTKYEVFLKTSSQETEGLKFVSNDKGITWVYIEE